MGLLRQAAILSFGKIANAALGFVLGVLVARVLGATAATDALFVAMIVPVYVARQLPQLLSIGLVPAVVESRMRESTRLPALIMSWWLLTLTAASILLAWAAPWIVRLAAPGFTAETSALATELLRVMLPSFLAMAIFGAGQAFFVAGQRVLAPELTGTLYRLCCVAALYLFGQTYGARGYAIGLSAAAVLQLLVLVGAGQTVGIRFLTVCRFWKGVAELRPAAKGMGVILLVLLFDQAGIFADRIFTSLMSPGTLSILVYGDRLARAVPQLLAVSLLTVFLPQLSAAQRRPDAQAAMGGALLVVLFCVGYPLALLLFWGAHDTAVLLMGQSRLTPEALAGVGNTIQACAFGVPAIICGMAFKGALYVARRTRPIVTLFTVSLAVRIVGCLGLYQYGAWGVALAGSLAEWCVVIYLWKGGRMGFKAPNTPVLRYLAMAATGMLLTLYLPPWASLVPVGLARLLCGAAASLGVFLLLLLPGRAALAEIRAALTGKTAA